MSPGTDPRNPPKRYRKRETQVVTAVPLDLETDGLRYRKWGDDQFAKPGDWLVNNNGEVYTIDHDSFAETYTEISPGRYRKSADVWATRAEQDGSVATKEGISHYRSGDYIVSNRPDGSDCYAIQADRFVAMYQPCEDESE